MRVWPSTWVRKTHGQEEKVHHGGGKVAEDAGRGAGGGGRGRKPARLRFPRCGVQAVRPCGSDGQFWTSRFCLSIKSSLFLCPRLASVHPPCLPLPSAHVPTRCAPRPACDRVSFEGRCVRLCVCDTAVIGTSWLWKAYPSWEAVAVRAMQRRYVAVVRGHELAVFSTTFAGTLLRGLSAEGGLRGRSFDSIRADTDFIQFDLTSEEILWAW